MSETLKLSALGQPFTLGMLYNACKDELMPGFTLWDKDALDNQTSTSTQKSSSFKITASDTMESRSSLLDVEASLNMSFMGGLVEVGGSAKYLNDQKKFKNQSRVTFQYKATTTFKQLSLPALGPLTSQQKQIIEKGRATHLVTGILYGANAVFVFDSEKVEASSVQDLQGSMQAVIKKIPTFKIEGSAKIHLSEEEKNLTNKFTCTFFGDLILEKNPATFVQAVETYCELPTLLADMNNNAPLAVWLYPLSLLHDKAATLIQDLSVALSRKIQQAMEDENEVKMRCNDSLYSSVAQDFPIIRKNIASFQKLCSFYKASLQLALSSKLPSIREGKEDESALAKVFDEGARSPFRREHLNRWLENKERDINVIRSCVDMMTENSNAYVVRTKSELDRVVLSAGVSNVLCYVFTDLDSNDPCLDSMAKYLDTSALGGTQNEYQSFSNEVVVQLRENARTFLKYARPLRRSASVKFLITAMPNSKYKGSSIYHYQDGLLVSDKFTVPAVPPVETITDRNHLIWYATELTLDDNTVNKNLTLSEENQKVTYGSARSYPSSTERFVDHPQVLCKEALSGRHYWEVEWRGHVVVAAAYSTTPRKNQGFFLHHFTNLNSSWGMHVNGQFQIQIAMGLGNIPVKSYSLSGAQKVGMFLDYAAGTLSVYGVSGNKLNHVFTFEIAFDQELYPGFAVYNKSNYAHLSF
ncbi:stonustoxin subunit alpha-like [Hippocampus comes]|uniref:stonustoxin subunit alpha-like n=1 Tax=Hippocampus comes TaxID=109280 RepID=UPI00094ED66A|nr:PREDICTED: stonustoxin subunit alpha-like [Hippocampus comes]